MLVSPNFRLRDELSYKGTERAKRAGGKPNDKITSNNIDYVDNDFIFVCE